MIPRRFVVLGPCRSRPTASSTAGPCLPGRPPGRRRPPPRPHAPAEERLRGTGPRSSVVERWASTTTSSSWGAFAPGDAAPPRMRDASRSSRRYGSCSRRQHWPASRAASRAPRAGRPAPGGAPPPARAARRRTRPLVQPAAALVLRQARAGQLRLQYSVRLFGCLAGSTSKRSSALSESSVGTIPPHDRSHRGRAAGAGHRPAWTGCDREVGSRRPTRGCARGRGAAARRKRRAAALRSRPRPARTRRAAALGRTGTYPRARDAPHPSRTAGRRASWCAK